MTLENNHPCVLIVKSKCDVFAVQACPAPTAPERNEQDHRRASCVEFIYMGNEILLDLRIDC